MTKQELFNTVVTGLKAQGYLRSMAAGQCAYRGANGRKCAAGHLIREEWYSPDLEGRASTYSAVQGVLRLSGVTEEDYELVKRLQLAHDSGSRDMEGLLRDVAATWGLSTEAM